MELNWKEKEKIKARMRRHHRHRLMKSRKGHWLGPLTNKSSWNFWNSDYTDKDESVRLGRLVDTPTPCSGPCCGNPRKWSHELTLQEKRAELDSLDESDYDWWWHLKDDVEDHIAEMEHPEDFGPDIVYEDWQTEDGDKFDTEK